MTNLQTSNNGINTSNLDRRSIDLRKTIVKMVESSRRGHIGSALSLVEILRVLFDHILRYDPKNPQWFERDRFVLSKGHGCLALYVLLAEKGFFPEEELWKFCRHNGLLGGHPETFVPGIEASTGSLGHGLSIGIGFALNAIMKKTSYRTFVVIGDGEANEGSIWEAAMCAARHKLSNLTLLVDYNKQQSYGSTSEVQKLEPFADKWKSFGMSVKEVNGHNVADLEQLLSSLPFESEKPSVIICHTVKGKGIDFLEGNLEWHHKNKLTDVEICSLYKALEVAQ